MTRTGRNEICPCGSGRKYKRCCLEREEERARGLNAARLERDRVLSEPAEEGEIESALATTFAAIRARDDETLVRLLERFAEFLASGGALEDLKFDDAAFAGAVERALASRGRTRGAKARELLFRSTIGELADRQLLRRFRDLLALALEAASLAAPDREAVAAAIMCLAPVVERNVPAADSPTLEVIFSVQLERWVKRQEAAARELDGAMKRLRAGTIDGEELEAIVRKAASDDPLAIESLLDSDGAMKDLDDAISRVVGTLRARKAPPIFTAAETIFLAQQVQREMEALIEGRNAPDEEQSQAARRLVQAAQRAFDSGLANDVCARIFAEATSNGHQARHRRFFRQLIAALSAEPSFVGALAYLSTLGRVHVRDAAERDLVERLAARQRLTAPDIESYCEYLTTSGDGAGLRRVRRALEEVSSNGIVTGLLTSSRPRSHRSPPDVENGDQLDFFG